MKKKHLGLAALAALLIGIAFAVYRWRASGFSWTEFGGALSGADMRWLAGSATMILVTYAGRAFRWNVMLKPLAPRASFWRVLSATCIGFTAVVFFGRAGEPVRPFLISRREGVPFTSQVAAWIVERILDLLMVLLLFAMALFLLARSGIHPSGGIKIAMELGGYVSGIGGLASLALLFGLRKFRGNIANRVIEALGFLPERFTSRIGSVLGSFEEGMAAVQTKRSVFLLIFYSFIEWAVIAAGFVCSFHAFSATAGFALSDVIVCSGFICLGSILQIPGIGGGIQVTTIVVLTELYGVKLEVATGISLTLWVVSFASVVPIGVLLALREGFHWSSIREIQAQSEAEESKPLIHRELQ